MKKSVAMALAASFVMSAAGTVFAAEVPNPLDIKFDGSVNLQYRMDDRSNGVDRNTGTRVADVKADALKTTFVLNAEKKLTDNLALYSRLTYQSFSSKSAEGYQQDYINEDYNGAIDAFGLKYNNAGVNYVLGSQALTLGATGLVYDNGFIGKHALPYALKVSGKTGATDLTAIYAKTNYQDGKDNDKFYVLQGQYAINDKSNVGAFYSHVEYGDYTKALVYDKESLNYYGINTSYKFTNKLSFVAEYIKSNADQDNKGYIGGFNYALDKNTTFGASAYRVEDQAAIVDGNNLSMTTAPFSNAKGYILTASHKLGSDITLNASYDTQDKIKDNSKAGATCDRNRTRVGVTINF